MEVQNVEKVIVELRGCRAIMDYDVAKLYGVETKRVNEAVRNNPEKFPEGYVFEVTKEESQCLRSKFSTLNVAPRGQHTKYPPKAFTEKGLYMLATILKSPLATKTTIAIVEAFARLRELARTVSQIADAEDSQLREQLACKCGECLSELLDEGLSVSGTETTVEINLAMLKFKHTIKRKK
jgi:hypothetical protein